ncbi:hypothetical protein PENSPDRAFT_167337 [Peniophora sp. CONT]|nr:hypothetical protein PENSPDRAFT_167337 [Peniophora sp. CONT]
MVGSVHSEPVHVVWLFQPAFSSLHIPPPHINTVRSLVSLRLYYSLDDQLILTCSTATMPIRSYRRTDVPMDSSPDDAPRQDTSFLLGATCSIGPPTAPRVSPSRIFQHASPGRIFNHPSPARSPGLASVRVPSPLGTPRGSPASRATPLGPRVETRRTPDVNVRTGGAYPNLAREMPSTHEAPSQKPTPHPQDADTMPNTGPFPRPILRTKTKRDVTDDESSRPRKRMRMDDADVLVRGMPGAWPYESTGVRAESLKERVERERGGRRRVRFGEPSVWVRC